MDDIRRKYGHGAIAYATPKDELGKVLERE